jgi:hypothetical protein
MRYGLDYAWHGTLNPAVWVRDGISFACRYVSKTPDKNLTFGEAFLLTAYKIDIVLVWETTTTRALEGYNAGKADATEAFEQAKALGMPAGRPIYFAVDTDTVPSRVTSYFDGILSVRDASEVGVYGGYYIIDGLVWKGYATYGWQTSAWSYGKWSPKASIQQFSYSYCGGGLVNADLNRTEAVDFGQWQLVQAGVGAVVEISTPPQESPSWDYSTKIEEFASALGSKNNDISYYSAKIRELISS